MKQKGQRRKENLNEGYILMLFNDKFPHKNGNLKNIPFTLDIPRFYLHKIHWSYSYDIHVKQE